MKKYIFILILLLLFITCDNKENNTYIIDYSLNIELKNDIYLADKPIDSVKKALIGKWKLCYTYGGFTPPSYNDTTRYKNTYWEFKEDSLLIINENGLIDSQKIAWRKESLPFMNGKEVNVISNIESPYSYSSPSPSFTMIILKYKNNYLILDNESYLDGEYYKFIKYNEQ